MPKTPKEKQENEETSEKGDEQKVWAEDQKKHEYYYDDAHGYKNYNSEKADEEED